tara:strand:- start:6718 stop:8217 length:1500 start_codon:yes stop_codon:yes gene_type:complete
MIVNFINKKVSPNFKIFFVNKDKKNITDYSISSNKEIQNNILNLLSKRNFNGLLNQISHIEILEKKINCNYLFIGVGENSEINEFNFQYFGGLIFSFFENLKYKKITFSVENLKKVSVSKESIILNLALGIKLKSYSFIKYKNIKKEKTTKIEEVSFFTLNSSRFKKMFLSYNAVTEGVFFSRDLLHEPPNVLNPVHLASRAKELTKLGLKVNILDEKKMKKLGMNALLGVGMGSANPSRLITLEWNGDPGSKKPSLGLVGKGVTFDTGGYSLKPSAGMEEMKMDMGGSALVLGVMKTLALRKAKSNVVAVIGAVENMVSSNAQRPSDIVKSMSGKSIEVLNTDAEGRLVLADALWYCQEKFKVKKMINFATLTGAIIVALGNLYAGLFSNSDKLSKDLITSANKTDEKIWRFPLNKEYDELLNCDIADVKNITGTGGAGSITAAQFLQRFVKKDVEWAHLDIAGVTWINKDLPLSKKGGTAFGVRLINDFILNNFEKK